MINDPIELVVTVVHRGKGEKIIDKLGKEGLHYIALGFGTARSEMLEMLGVGETEKDVMFSLIPRSMAAKFMEDVHEGFNFHLPNGGIVFLVGTTAISKILDRTIKGKGDYTPEEVPSMGEEKKYSCIFAVINRGYSDTVMEAATKFGARGGTVIHARGVGSEEAGQFLGVKLQPEKEIVMLVVRQKDKVAIMKAVAAEAGMKTEAAGFMFALPVDDFGGIA